MTVQEGKPAPAFDLESTDGPHIALKDLKGKKVVLYFYPKDDTSGCTLEACNFRDHYPTFDDAVVLGVSPDDIKSHHKFKAKYKLPFELLADPGHAVAEKYGVWKEKSMYGRKYMGNRAALHLSSMPPEKIAKIFPKVKVPDHYKEVRDALDAM